MTDRDYVDLMNSTIVRSHEPSALVRAAGRTLSALAPGLAARVAARLFLTPPRPRRPAALLSATEKRRPATPHIRTG